MFFRARTVPAPEIASPSSKETSLAPASSGPEPIEHCGPGDGVQQKAPKHVSAVFGDIVSIMMRSRHHKHNTLQDLEWLVAPAIHNGQFALAEARSKKTNQSNPAGVLLWALVSKDVDQRLSNSLDQPLRLSPAEWHSGDIPWIVVALGEQRSINGLLQQVAGTLFKGTPLKLRARNKDGKVTVGFLKAGSSAVSPPAE